MNESIRLLSTKDGADKEYRVQLEAKEGGFIVTGFKGRRGGPLKAQPKIASPVPYVEAKKAYDALVKSKLKGGYNPADAGADYVVPADIGTPTGIKLHLLTQFTSDVKISWNGACKSTQESIMLGSKWEESLRNLREFIAVRDAHAASGGNRCRVTLQLTFLESNVEELADIVQLGIELGVDRIKGHHLWAHFPQIEALSMRRNADAILRWNIAVEKARRIALERPLANGRTVLLENIFPLNEGSPQELTPDGLCPFLGQEAWVSAQGRFDPCCAPDAQRRTLGSFGYLLDTPLLDIWRGDAYRVLVASYRNRSLCASCNMRTPARDDR